MINTIYLLVAILMFVSFTQYFGEEERCEMWKKRFHSVMRVVFLMSNIICFILVKQNEYFYYYGVNSTNTGEEMTFPIGYILFALPIIIYLIEGIYFLLNKKDLPSLLGILWLVYAVLLVIVVVYSPLVESDSILKEQDNVISFREEIVKSTFVNDSVDGIDYIIKQQNSYGAETDNVINTRTGENYPKVKIYPNEESSYIEEYDIVETHFSFLWGAYETNTGNKMYKIYLTDELYQSR